MPRSAADRATSTDLDVVVIGAGFAGLYAVHRLRDRHGLAVRAFEAGSGVGGTWYWNRYPGARCDIESVHYSYSFSEALQRDWQWSERFSAQPEILRYLEHVADRFDLRRDIQFDTRVTSIVWNDSAGHWTVGTDDGISRTARFVVSGAGNLSIAKKPEFPGIEEFGGEVYATHLWPHEGVDLTGKRVGVIGTGATGIQLIPKVAERAAHLTVFQRTPNYAVPLRNRPTDPVEQEQVLASYPELRVAARNNFLGVPYDQPRPSAVADPEPERQRVYDKYYGRGGFQMLISTYQDLLFDRAANDTAAQYIRDRITERVRDPELAAQLSPTDHAYGTKRPPMETDYYETYNRDNVTLVDVRAAPIEAVTSTGLRTADGTERELDVIVLATGFDAFTRALLNMGIVGRDGLTLERKWADGPRTFLGIAVHGFPNLFTLTGPQSAVALYNNPLAIEDHVEFAGDAIRHVLDSGLATIEATEEAERDWGRTVAQLADATLMPQADSWYMGANIPGKPRSCMIYLGGAPAYRACCDEVVAGGYRGFELSPVTRSSSIPVAGSSTR
jgi:cation diffusion facilitator CzcD-associated flavoprotein CzcO